MGIVYNQDTSNCKTALDILTQFPNTAGKDNYYMVFPQGRNAPGQLVYCDMTTDGGGWMLIARSHSTGSVSNWGFRGPKIGDVKNFTQPYQAGWFDYFQSATYTSFLFGNRANVNNNSWGPFIYKKSGLNSQTFLYSETFAAYTSSVVKTTLSIFNSSSYPGMQSVTGLPISGTAANHYMLRDCCGLGYGGYPNGFSTVYLGHVDLWAYAGPWGAGSTTDGSGNYIQTTADPKVSGTNQYMIFVK